MSLLSDIGGFLSDIKNEADEISQPVKDLKNDLTDDYRQAKQGLTEPISQVSETISDISKDS